MANKYANYHMGQSFSFVNCQKANKEPMWKRHIATLQTQSFSFVDCQKGCIKITKIKTHSNIPDTINYQLASWPRVHLRQAFVSDVSKEFHHMLVARFRFFFSVPVTVSIKVFLISIASFMRIAILYNLSMSSEKMSSYIQFLLLLQLLVMKWHSIKCSCESSAEQHRGHNVLDLM